ncbi:hypothetical protein DMI66_00850 [Escherichia coli]|nr:hypothetical protein [Escherichia coli]
MDNSQLPLQLTGEAKQADLILYARLPAQLSGSLSDPTLTFELARYFVQREESLIRWTSMKSAGL